MEQYIKNVIMAILQFEGVKLLKIIDQEECEQEVEIMVVELVG
jgi:hypothetical protein